MTTLAADKPRKFLNVDQEVQNGLPCVTADIIYAGALVGDNASGYARPLVAGDEFWGVCKDKCDNSGGANGAKNVEVKARCFIEVDVTGASAVTDVNSTVYASDDDTLTLSSTSNSTVGKIIRWISGTTCVVKLEAAYLRSI